MNTTVVSQWGNSLAIRLPKKLTRKFNLNKGKKLDLIPKDGLIELKISSTNSLEHNKTDWNKFLIKTGKTDKQNISTNIDSFLYEKNN